MSNLTTALVLVLTLNVLIFLAQAGIDDLNPNAVNFYDSSGSLIDGFNGGTADNPSLDKDALTNALPTAEGSISPETGNFFTDVFSSIKNWVTGLPGISYLYGIIMAPYNMLKMAGLPNAFTWAVGSLWYGLTLFLIVAFIWGRDA